MEYLDVNWTLANCTGKPLNWFFSLKQSEIKLAKGLCADCPIKQDCLQYSVEKDEFGLWAGLTRKERLDLYGDHQEQESQMD